MIHRPAVPYYIFVTGENCAAGSVHLYERRATRDPMQRLCGSTHGRPVGARDTVDNYLIQNIKCIDTCSARQHRHRKAVDAA